MNTYSVLEASEKLGVSSRAVQKRCKKDVVRKKDNKYLITDLLLEKWSKEIQSNEPQTNQTNEPTNQPLNIADLQHLKLDEIENFEFEFKKDGEPSKKGNLVFVPKGLIYAEYTEEEYNFAEKKLEEWRFQNEKIKSQQELFEAKEKGLNDVVSLMTEQAEHYKNQFQYQKEQSTRILDMHEQLIKTIQQNNFITAKSRGYDEK
jgi:hypothetical protein